ncbi:MAG: hypothetical protein R3300_02215 [Candidatus Promineifilaceae bacterium]|nr:hypothetical protein [Candidatus Promineifilaceae bacterium]
MHHTIDKRAWLALFFLIITLTLAACQSAAESPSPTATATVESPAATPSLAVEATATIATTADSQPTRTVAAEPVPTETSAVAEQSDVLCQSVPRPALLLIDRGEYFISDFLSSQSCPLAFPGEFPGLIQAGGDSLFYHQLDPASQRAVVMRLAPDGTSGALPFTAGEPPAQFLHYIVSPDGQRIAWSVSRPDATGSAVSDLWLSETSGAGLVQLIDGWPAADNRLLMPVRFSADGQTLYFTAQPNGVGGSWVAFSGRYDNLYALPTTNGQPLALFQCPDGNLLCLGDFDGDVAELKLAYTDPTTQAIIVLGPDGRTLSQFIFPEADFLGYPSFSPSGELAFYTAVIGEHADGYPIPVPGTLHLVADGQAQPLKSDDSVATLIGWLDDEYLIYNSIDPGGNWGTSVVGLAGDIWIWGPGPTQFITVLR